MTSDLTSALKVSLRIFAIQIDVYFTLLVVRFRPCGRINSSSSSAAKHLRRAAAKRSHVEVASSARLADFRPVTQTHTGLRGPVQDRGPVGRPDGPYQRRSYVVRVENGVARCQVSLQGVEL